MRCTACRQAITPSQESKAKIEKTPEGRPKAAYHFKCWFIKEKKRSMGPDGKYFAATPTAYEESAKRQTADDLTVEAKDRRAKAEAEYARLTAQRIERQNAVVAEKKTLHEAAMELDGIDELVATAAENLALAKRQEEIAEQRALEETPKGWTDTRDPVTKDI